MKYAQVYPPLSSSDKEIFVVTALFYTNRILRSRLWGFFYDRGRAEEACLRNETEMCEAGYYNYFVVENFPEGICHTHTAQETWFHVQYDSDENETTVIPVTKPEGLKHFIHFGMS